MWLDVRAFVIALVPECRSCPDCDGHLLRLRESVPDLDQRVAGRRLSYLCRCFYDHDMLR